MASIWDFHFIYKIHIYRAGIREFLLPEDTYNEWAIFIVEEGSFRYELDGTADIAEKDDLIFVRPGQLFKRQVELPLSFHLIHMGWEDAQRRPLQNPPLIPTGKVRLSNLSRLHSTLSMLQMIPDSIPYDKHIWKAHLARDVWYMYCLESTERGFSYQISTENTDLRNILKQLHQEVFDKCSIKEIAQKNGLSQVQLTRLFKTAFGINPKQYVTALRLHQAEKLLCETTLTLAQIAVRCGYENEFYFSRIFTKKMQLTPSEYRRTHKI